MDELNDKSGRWRRMRRRFAASLSLKLIGIFVGGSIALAILIGLVSQFGLERQFFDTARPLLNHYVSYLERELGSPPSVERARELTDRWPVVIRIFDPERNIRWASDQQPRQPRLHRPSTHPGPPPPHLRRMGKAYWDHGTILLMRNDGQATVYYGFRVRPKGPPWFPLIFVSLVLGGLYLFYLSTRRLFAPIRTIEEGVRRIGDGQLDHRIEMDRYDELGSLAAQVNQMAARLQSMLRARRDLLLAISHELKSPLARSRVTLELLDESDYREALLNDHAEMQRLIDGIIQAERDQGDFSTLQREPVDVAGLIDALVARSEDLGAVSLRMDSRPLVANVDALQIERLVRNLLENALRYNRPDAGRVELQAALAGEQLSIIVEDHGPGIEEQHLGRLTEAFYRVDSSRERGTGGLGLGLYLCQAVVDAHGGSMRIISEVGKGTRVECLLPAE